MSTFDSDVVKTVLPFKQYNTFLSNYSKPNQIQADNYKNIIESETSQAYFNREYPSLEAASNGRLNPNVPVYRDSQVIFVEDKPVNVYKQFWQYKQNGGSIFTDYKSAGVSNNYEDISIRNLPLKSMGLDKPTPQLVLSNTNNVRNNMQNYGKQYLLTQNMLNSEAFQNGVYYQMQSTSPYRPGDINEAQQIEHSQFANKLNGDQFSRQKNILRVDLPSNYAQTSLTSWQTINPICIKPNDNTKLDWITRMRFGLLNLDALLFIGNSCLNKDFNIIPPGFEKPVDVFADDMNYPPITNSDYFTPGPLYFKKEGMSNGLFCSSNSNYIAVPINHKYPDLDTSINFNPGNNSISLGMIMQPALKDFINKELYNFNKMQILRGLKEQYKNEPEKLKNLMKTFPEIKNDKVVNYNQFNEEEKYIYLYNEQRSFHDRWHMNPQLAGFIINLNIVKFGGTHSNYDLKAKANINMTSYEIGELGVFLLLPSMLSEDLFDIKSDTFGDCGGDTLRNRSQSCCFQGPANEQSPNDTFYPALDASYDPSMSNLRNAGCGTNPYNAPNTF